MITRTCKLTCSICFISIFNHYILCFSKRIYNHKSWSSCILSWIRYRNYSSIRICLIIIITCCKFKGMISMFINIFNGSRICSCTLKHSSTVTRFIYQFPSHSCKSSPCTDCTTCNRNIHSCYLMMFI